MPRKRLLGIPKRVEELPDFGLFGGNFQNRWKSLKRISNQPEKFVANKIGTTAFEVRKLDPESIWNRNASQSGPNFSGPNLAFTIYRQKRRFPMLVRRVVRTWNYLSSVFSLCILDTRPYNVARRREWYLIWEPAKPENCVLPWPIDGRQTIRIKYKLSSAGPTRMCIIHRVGYLYRCSTGQLNSSGSQRVLSNKIRLCGTAKYPFAQLSTQLKAVVRLSLFFQNGNNMH